MTNTDSNLSELPPTVRMPLPSPDSRAYDKEPGFTQRSLEKLVLSNTPHIKQQSASTAGWSTPSSPSPSESDCWSVPSSRPPSRPPSQAPSRAPSMSAGKSGGKVAKSSKKDLTSSTPHVPLGSPEPGSAATLRPKSASVHSDSGGHKFNLKDLLAAGPKLSRKSSARSTGSSKKSDSDGKSNAGDSAVSLTKKYGVCQKVAIGKGATSVVRLAHKWDRSEEKLYAVKVCD